MAYGEMKMNPGKERGTTHRWDFLGGGEAKRPAEVLLGQLFDPGGPVQVLSYEPPGGAKVMFVLVRLLFDLISALEAHGKQKRRKNLTSRVEVQ